MSDPLPPYTIIAGFGLPGRAAADAMELSHIEYCVIELNANTVHRCEKYGVKIIEGDATDPATLAAADISRATLFVMAIPIDSLAVKITHLVRTANPTCRIITRCSYTSTGLQALHAGASEVIVAEKVVAEEFTRALTK